MNTQKENLSITFTSMEITNIPTLDHPRWTCTNLIAQIGQYQQHNFSLNDIYEDQTKLHVGALYLDPERWKWWQRHQKRYPKNITWHMFSKALFDRFDRESNFLGCLTKLQQTGTIKDYNAAFETLAIRNDSLGDDFYLECSINGLKEAI